MLRVLLAKDLRRALRNPLPWLINLIVPLAMTALVGLVFGGHSDSGALGRIRFAVVDEDKTVLSDFLRGAANQGEGGKYLEPVFMEREDGVARDQCQQNQRGAHHPDELHAQLSHGARSGEPGTDQESGGVNSSGGAGGIARRGRDGVECGFAQFQFRVSRMAGGVRRQGGLPQGFRVD